MSNNEEFFGEVIWFEGKKGYGFILWEKDGIKQNDLFLHFSDLLIDGFKIVYKNQKVSFNIGKNNNGDPKAINVSILK